MLKLDGNILYFVKNYLVKTIGKEKFDDLIKGLDKKSKEVFETPIFSSEFYEVKPYEELLEQINKKHGKKIITEFIEFLSEKQLKSYYGFLVKFISLDKIVKKSKELWGKTFTEGNLEIKEYKDNILILNISDMKTTDLHIFAISTYLKKWIYLLVKKEITMNIKKIKDNEWDINYKY